MILASFMQDLASVSQVVFSIFGTVASVAISVVVYRSSRRKAEADYWKGLLDAWTAVDTVVLQKEEFLDVVESLFADDLGEVSNPKFDPRVKAQIAFLYLNPLAITYTGIDRGLIDGSLLTSLDSTLSKMIRDPEIFRLTQEGCLHPGFAEYCKGLSVASQKQSPGE